MIEMDANSVDAIVCDPPYGIMGDSTAVAFDVATWEQALRTLKPGSYLTAFGSTRTYHRLVCAIEDAGFDIRDTVMWLHGQGFPKGDNLKPACEPIVLARKPKKGGSSNKLNIDKCRIGTDDIQINKLERWSGFGQVKKPSYTPVKSKGRWPANIMLDEQAATMLDKQSEKVGSGGASRFFYCAKANKKERGEGNMHPTVKPIELMRWLVRLVTPPNGTVLDPFAGTGTTGIACIREGFNFLGLEIKREYCQTARRRISQCLTHG